MKTLARFVIGFVLLFLWVATFPPLGFAGFLTIAIAFSVMASVWFSHMKMRLKILMILGIAWTWWNLWIVFFFAHDQTKNLLAAVLTFLILAMAGLAVLGFLYWLAGLARNWMKDRKISKMFDTIEKKL